MPCRTITSRPVRGSFSSENTIRQLYPQEHARKPSNSPDNLCVPSEGAKTSSSISLKLRSICGGSAGCRRTNFLNARSKEAVRTSALLIDRIPNRGFFGVARWPRHSTPPSILLPGRRQAIVAPPPPFAAAMLRSVADGVSERASPAVLAGVGWRFPKLVRVSAYI
jgi:hypothetical protein